MTPEVEVERYTVIRDTKEKKGHGWIFDPSPACTGTIIESMKTADYTLKGYEHLFCVERKGSVQEFVQNITQKEKWVRFKDELQRMEDFSAAYIVCEFTLDDVMRYPVGSGLPYAIQKKVRVSPQFYLKRLIEIELNFKARMKLVGKTHSKEYASSLFKRVIEKYGIPSPRT
jgi:hypothetical protein